MTKYDRPTAPSRLFSRTFAWLARKGLAPSNSVQIEVKGRKSGELRSAVINVVEFDGQRYFVAPRGETEWVRNVRAAGGEAVVNRRGRRRVRLEEVPVEQRPPIIQKYLGENAMATKSFFGVDPKSDLSVFEGIAAKHPTFRIVEVE
ncbi:MAG: hypothetical protein WD379_05530 [Dehalococcoidia bacterium]